MSITNEKMVEEMMWIAFTEDMATELVELAGRYMSHDSLSRHDAYHKAFFELGLTIEEQRI